MVHKHRDPPCFCGKNPDLKDISAEGLEFGERGERAADRDGRPYQWGKRDRERESEAVQWGMLERAASHSV